MINDSDDVIADGLVIIRQGILNNDMDAIIDGYKYITGEELKKVSRLNKIRTMVEDRSHPSQAKENPTKQKNKTKPKTNDNPKTTEEDVGRVVEIKKDGITIISTELDQDELMHNEKVAKKRTRIPRPEPKPSILTTGTKNTSGDFNYNPNLTEKPPSRSY